MKKLFLTTIVGAMLMIFASASGQLQARGVLQQTTPSATMTATSAVQKFTLLNLNTVTSEQILSIPGIANSMTREFAEYRPRVSIVQFRKEIGKYLDAATIAGYEKYVYVPVQVDASDAETLKQIPGVTDQIAANLIAGRPYKTNDAFLTKLGTLLNADQVSLAWYYLEGDDPSMAPTAAPTAASTAVPTLAATSAVAAQSFALFNLNTVTSEQS